MYIKCNKCGWERDVKGNWTGTKCIDPKCKGTMEESKWEEDTFLKYLEEMEKSGQEL